MTRWFVGILLGALVAGCGGADIGEACDDTGSTDECVDGAICDTVEGERAECLAICDDDVDCDAGFSCNGVSGSNIKACHQDGE